MMRQARDYKPELPHPKRSFIRTCKKDNLRCVDNACAVSVMTLTPALPQGPAGRVGEGSEDEVEAASRRPLVTTVHHCR